MQNSELKYRLQAYKKEELIKLILFLNKSPKNQDRIVDYFSKEKSIDSVIIQKYNNWLNAMKEKYGPNFIPSMCSSEELEEGTELDKKYKDALRRLMK